MKIDDQGMLTGSNGLVCTRGNAGVIDHSPEVHVGISRCRAAFRSRDGDSVWQVVRRGGHVMGSGPRGIPHVFRLVAAKPAFVLVVVFVLVIAGRR